MATHVDVESLLGDELSLLKNALLKEVVELSDGVLKEELSQSLENSMPSGAAVWQFDFDLTTDILARSIQTYCLTHYYHNKGEFGKALRFLNQSTFEFGQYDGALNAKRQRAQKNARKRHQEDLATKATLHRYWLDNLANTKTKIAIDEQVKILKKREPLKESTLKAYIAEWRRESKEEHASAIRKQALRDAFPTLADKV